MAKVIVDLTMSLDGFIAGPKDDEKQPLGLRGGDHLQDWYFNGKTPNKYNDFFSPDGKNREVLDEIFETTGAFICGRRTYDFTHGFNGTHPINGVPVFVLTHQPPETIPKGKSSFIFITDGIENAVKQAKIVADKKNVLIGGGASPAQQAIKARLVDEIFVHIAPMLLGDGVKLFDHLGDKQMKLENSQVIEGQDATHLRFKVI